MRAGGGEDSEEPFSQEKGQGIKYLNQVALWRWVQLAWGQFGGCCEYFSQKVHGESQATPRINKNSFFLVRVWLTAVVNFDLNWVWNVLVSSPKLRPICTTSKKDKVNNFYLDFLRCVSLDHIARTLWHQLTPKGTQTLGILSTSKKGHFFEMWQLPRMTFSFKLHGYQRSQGQKVKQSKLILFDYKRKCIFLMSLHRLPS